MKRCVWRGRGGRLGGSVPRSGAGTRRSSGWDTTLETLDTRFLCVSENTSTDQEELLSNSTSSSSSRTQCNPVLSQSSNLCKSKLLLHHVLSWNTGQKEEAALQPVEGHHPIKFSGLQIQIRKTEVLVSAFHSTHAPIKILLWHKAFIRVCSHVHGQLNAT